jgi:hypothetical protein
MWYIRKYKIGMENIEITAMKRKKKEMYKNENVVFKFNVK